MPERPQTANPIERGTLSETEVRGLAARLYRSEGERLRAIAAQHGPAEVPPEDTVQAAFATFVERFDLTEELARAWLVTTTKRLAWRARRTVSRRREAIEPQRHFGGEDEQLVYRIAGEAADPLARVIDREQSAERRMQIDELPPAEREVAVLGALGYVPSEIEDITGLTSRQIRRLVERANRRLATMPARKGGAESHRGL